MQSTRGSAASWPRARLRCRAIISTTMVVGWFLVALGGLLPYYFLPRGAGSSGEQLLGMSRSVWISIHLWLSVGMVALTLGHVLLNRRGVTRGFRVVSGSRLGAGPAAAVPPGAPPRRKPWGWAAVLILVAGLIGGGVVFAADHGTDGGRSGGRRGDAPGAIDGPMMVAEEAAPDGG